MTYPSASDGLGLRMKEDGEGGGGIRSGKMKNQLGWGGRVD